MLFGDKSDFAIECYRDHRDQWLEGHVCGRMCIWCAGHQLGDIDNSNMLGTIKELFSKFLECLPSLTDEAIDHLPDLDAFTFLDSHLFLGYEGQSDEQTRIDAQRFSKFIFLTNWDEQFDGEKAFLLKTDNGFRILYRISEQQVGVANVSAKVLQNAVSGFLKWMTEQKAD